jgi:uncharacterized protein (PEP-CTERM system associated)
VFLGSLVNQHQSAKKHQSVKQAALLLISMPISAFCQEVNVNGSLSSTAYVYETEIGNNEATKTESFTIKPSIRGSYSSRGISASLAANHTRVKRNFDSDIVNANVNDSTDQNYTSLRYTSALTLIKNSLFLTLNGNQDYRVVNQQQAIFCDEILTCDDLTKSRNNSAQLRFSIPNPIYIGFDLQSSYSKTQTGQSQEGQTGVDGDNLGVTARLYQGKNLTRINFNISAQYNDTSRANSQNFESTRVQGNLGLPIIERLDVIITGSTEDNNTGQTETTNLSNLDTTSYGAGLKWKGNKGNISLTYNRLEQGDNQTNFWGGNIDWAFSPRTALNFDYGKRFYGDTYSLGFRHSLKSLRTSVSYSEDVTSFSRFAASSNNIAGIFVCEFGSTELIDCFQPDSLDYQLQAGEEFRSTSEIDTDISEEVLLRKSGTASIGYDKRKVKISVDATYSKTEYLESDRLSTNRSLRFNFTYTLGRSTNISFASTVARNQFSELEQPDTITTSSIDFGRDLGRYLKLNIAARLLDRESDNLERNSSDKRLTVGLNYTF